MRKICKKLTTTSSMLFGCLMIVILLSAGMVKAQEVTLSTDKDDYFPGEWVVITGTGWQGDDSVKLTLTHLDPLPEPIHTHDIWFVKPDSTGKIHYEWYVNEEELGTSLQLDALGIPTGRTATTFFTDAVISISSVSSAPEFCLGEIFTVTFNATGIIIPFNANNYFYVDLSDADGTWPTTNRIIGQKGPQGNGNNLTISATIPMNIPAGTNYRIRVRSSNPVVTTTYSYLSGFNLVSNLTINTVPAQPSKISGSDTPCEGTTETYSVTNVPGVTYNWSYPSGWTGNSTSNGITLTVGSASGNVTVTPSNSCGNGISQTLTVTIANTGLSQPGEISGPIHPCQGSVQTYSVTKDPGVNYIWTLPSGWTGSSSSQIITVTVGSGSGDISLVPYKNNNCPGPARTLAVTVDPLPSKPDAISGSTTPCLGTTQIYSVTNVPGVTYTWSLPAGWSGSSTTNSITAVIGSGSGNIAVTPANACGNGSSRTLAVTIHNLPSQPGMISGPVTPYQGTKQIYSVTAVEGVTYSWSLPYGWTIIGNSTGSSIIVSVGTGSGDISITPSNDCGNGTAQTLTVSPVNCTRETFISGGSFTVPAGVNQIIVEAWGGGGSGGSGGSLAGAMGGGGGGAYASSTLDVTPGTAFGFTVGAGGIPTQFINDSGSDGGVTNFGDMVIAEGGDAGAPWGGGAGGTIANSTGQIKYAGGTGGSPLFSFLIYYGGGGGGGSAFEFGNGNNGNVGGYTNGGAGGTGTGDGGAGGAPGDSGLTGLNPGGGGGGKGNFGSSSGSGSPGQIIIYYYVSCTVPEVPVASASPSAICNGSSSVLTITSGNLNGADHWQWYSGSCGGTQEGTGTSIEVSPSSTTTYYVRGEGGCVETPGDCGSVIVTVNDQPSAGIITRNPDADIVCTGTGVSATFGSGSGGLGCTDSYDYRFDDAEEWITYSPGTTLNTSGHYRVEIRTQRGGCQAGCTPGIRTVSWQVESTPESGGLEMYPDLGTVCQGSEVYATLIHGTGGSGDDETQFRTYDGTNWTGWTNYDPGTKILTTGMIKVEIRTYRLADACSPSSIHTVSWKVETAAVAGTFTKDPDVETICEGTTVRASLTPGSGGNGDDEAEFRTFERTRWSDWSHYTPGTDISTTYKSTVEVRTQRLSDACSNSTYNTVKWNVESTPVNGTVEKNPETGPVCEGINVYAIVSPGSGGIQTDETQFRTFDGTNWSEWAPYVSGTSIGTTGKTDVEVRTHRLTSVCVNTSFNSVHWNIEATPVAGTLTKTPDAALVCEGTDVYASLTPGSGGSDFDQTGFRTNNGTLWSDWAEYFSGTNIPTTGLTAVEIRTRRTADFCESSSYNTVSWNVEATPVNGTLTRDPDVSPVCEGTSVKASLTPGTGGNGSDETLFRTYNGTDWSAWAAYTPGTPVGTSGKTMVEIRTHRLSSECVNLSFQTIVWNVEITAVAGILTKTPDAEKVCEGTEVNATLTPGSGGNGIDETEFRTNNGTDWSVWAAYTPGTSIGTSGKTMVEIRTHRLGGVCEYSSYNSVSWAVEPTPVAGTLARDPDTSPVCEGTIVKAILTPGAGGNGIDETTYRTHNGTDWSAWADYTSGTPIGTTDKTGVEIRTRRLALVCTPAEYNTVSWIVNLVPDIVLSSSATSAQYSDPVTPVILTVNDDGYGSNLSITGTQWNFNGGSFSSGLPSNLGIDLTSTGLHSRIWTLSGKAMVREGTYLIRITVSDGMCSSTAEIKLTVTCEDAIPYYTGAYFSSTANATSSSAVVTLSATIKDIFAANPSSDPYPGDITNAKVTFFNRDNNTIIVSDVPVGLVNTGDKTVGTATANWNVSITGDAQSFTIGIIINGAGYYCHNSSEDNTVITVAKPLSDFITGGGYLILSAPAGLKAGDVPSRNNFGFNVKFNKSKTNLQGNINSIIRRTESGNLHIYQVKGNSMTSLSVQPLTASSPAMAVFNGKASIQDITDPNNPVAVDGNASLQVTMTDNGEPGSGNNNIPYDLISITVWDKQGGLWFASNWDGTKTVEQSIAGGNLRVQSSGSFIPGTTATTLDLTSSLNPSPQGVTVIFTSKITVSGTKVPTGYVRFADGGKTLAVVPLGTTGVVSYATSSLSTGSHDITAFYGGDKTFNTSSDLITQVVNPVLPVSKAAIMADLSGGKADLMVYPNPFSEKVRFEFVSPVDVTAVIHLYDVTGRLVQTAFHGEVKAGVNYNAEFKPADDVTGIYFYRATIGDNVFAGKVIYKK